MKLISRLRSPKYVFRHATVQTVSTASGVAVAQPVEGIRFRFNPLTAPIFTFDLPTTKDGELAGCHGMLDTKDLKRRHPRLTQEEIDDFFLQHPAYGVEFIAYDDKGKALEAHTTAVFRERGKNHFECLLCEKVLTSPTAKIMHERRSKKHQELLEKHQQKAAAQAAASSIAEGELTAASL